MSRPARLRGLNALVGGIAAASAVGLVLLWPSGEPGPEVPALASFEGVYPARTEERVERACTGAEEGARCVRATFRLEDGPDEGARTEIELPADSGRVESIRVGSHVLLGHQPGVRGFEYVFLEPDRRSSLFALAGLFALAVVLLGRRRGVAALVGLVATLAVVFVFVVPAILDGRDPLLVSLVGAVVIACAALYLSHGFEERTTVALLGTLGGLACAALLAVLFMNLAEITGLASEEALLLAAVGTDVDLRGLILGGMLVGALGAIDDMTVTQATAVWELRAADPAMPSPRLMRAGMRIGRAHVASTVNTLVLAYAGASMPLLILFVLADQPPTIVASGEIVATEIVRTLVGSLGLVASVPITTWLAVRVVGGGGRHARAVPGPVERLRPDDDLEGPEEHPIPEHRRDLVFARLRARRARRRPDR